MITSTEKFAATIAPRCARRQVDPCIDDNYISPSSSALIKARREAVALAAVHDCESLERLHQQYAAMSTKRIAAAVAELKCPKPCDTVNVDEMMAQAQTRYTAGYAKSALQLMLKALA